MPRAAKIQPPLRERQAERSSDHRRAFEGTVLVIGACVVSSIHKLIVRSHLPPDQLASPSRFILSIEWDVVFIALVVAIVIFRERRKLDSIGWRAMSSIDALSAVAIAIIGVSIHKHTAPMLPKLGLSRIAIPPPSSPLLDWGILLLGSAAEETVFRGYLIERLEMLSGRTSVAVAISCALFALCHYPLWGMQNVLVSAVWGMILAMFYVWRRNLPANFVMHLATDMMLSGAVRFSIRHAPSTRDLHLELLLRIFR